MALKQEESRLDISFSLSLLLEKYSIMASFIYKTSLKLKKLHGVKGSGTLQNSDRTTYSYWFSIFIRSFFYSDDEETVNRRHVIQKFDDRLGKDAFQQGALLCEVHQAERRKITC